MRLLLFLSVAAAALAGGPWVEVPAGGAPMLPADPLSVLRTNLSSGGAAATEIVDADGMPFARAMRVTVKTVPSVPWGVQIMATTTGDIQAGDVLLLALFARGSAENNESGDAYAVAYLQDSRPPNTKLGSQPVNAGTEWRQFLLPFRVSMSLAQGQHNFTIHMGYYFQTLEVGGLSLLNYGASRTLAELPRTKPDYTGREPDAAWRKEAAQRIEQIRKADIAVRAVDSGGNPLAGAKVRVEMKRHAFAFGSAVTAQMLAVETSDGYKYRWIVENYFNKVVFENDLKWPPWETAKSNTHGSYRRQWIDAAFAWLAERGIKVRGHYVSWAPLDSADGHGNGPLETLRERLFAHMEDKLPAVGDRAFEWDAVNHIAGWGETLETRYGADIYAEIIRRARRLAPGAGLWVNEGQILPSGSRRNEYERLIRYLVEHDSAPDGIGMMGHFEEASLTGLPEVYKVMNRFAGLVPRLQLTELDVNTADERLHADYLRDIMTMAFSHPAFTGIVMWGFWEGRHWRPDAALWRRDWSIKPAGEVWLDLVFNQWWTDTELTADEAGLAQTRGFLGDYRITVTWQGQSRTIEASLDSKGLAMDVTL